MPPSTGPLHTHARVHRNTHTHTRRGQGIYHPYSTLDPYLFTPPQQPPAGSSNLPSRCLRHLSLKYQNVLVCQSQTGSCPVASRATPQPSSQHPAYTSGSLPASPCHEPSHSLNVWSFTHAATSSSVWNTLPQPPTRVHLPHSPRFSASIISLADQLAKAIMTATLSNSKDEGKGRTPCRIKGGASPVAALESRRE